MVPATHQRPPTVPSEGIMHRPCLDSAPLTLTDGSEMVRLRFPPPNGIAPMGIPPPPTRHGYINDRTIAGQRASCSWWGLTTCCCWATPDRGAVIRGPLPRRGAVPPEPFDDDDGRETQIGLMGWASRT